MAESDKTLAALDEKIAKLRAELDRLIAVEKSTDDPDQHQEETISDVEVQLRSLERQRKDLGEAA